VGRSLASWCKTQTPPMKLEEEDEEDEGLVEEEEAWMEAREEDGWEEEEEDRAATRAQKAPPPPLRQRDGLRPEQRTSTSRTWAVMRRSAGRESVSSSLGCGFDAACGCRAPSIVVEARKGRAVIVPRSPQIAAA
jgi:hypothetical protein